MVWQVLGDERAVVDCGSERSGSENLTPSLSLWYTASLTLTHLSGSGHLCPSCKLDKIRVPPPSYPRSTMFNEAQSRTLRSPLHTAQSPRFRNEAKEYYPIDLADSSPYTECVWVKALRPKRIEKVPCRKAQSLVTISSFSRSQCKCKSSWLPKSRHGHRGSWKRLTETVILSVFLCSVVLSCASALLTWM